MTLTESHNTTSLFYIAPRRYALQNDEGRIVRGTRTRETFIARSPAGSSPPRHGDGRGSRGGPRSVTSEMEGWRGPSPTCPHQSAHWVPRAPTIISSLEQFLYLARDTTWVRGKGTGRGWRALLYLRGVIEAIQQY
ncbi:hypothetical protein ALC56_03206 [Trachymyrmex septentrionalis]|uniref:Uncharacterized protein n=1 Tax=Trachymyrmex septentrionalis TaxID=34720 RepID=A0A195FNN3_9HYME|nr:hypothetical protein ALC56_03206 [Trachymyrmex septentrionalis]